MICAGEGLTEDGETKFELAIVGAGAVGIALAVRLAGRVGRIALIEAGDTQFRPAQDLEFFKASSVDDERHPPTHLYRRRMLGGTTSVWGGWCIPFDPEDFAPARERPGWPITFAEFEAHVPDALEFLDAGRPEFSAAAALPMHPVPVDEAVGTLALDRIERYSKPTNVWRKWQQMLARSGDITVIHGVACTSVITNADNTRVVAIELRTQSNKRRKILAPTIEHRTRFDLPGLPAAGSFGRQIGSRRGSTRSRSSGKHTTCTRSARRPPHGNRANGRRCPLRGRRPELRSLGHPRLVRRGSGDFLDLGLRQPTLTAVALAFRLAEHLVRRQTTANAPVRPIV